MPTKRKPHSDFAGYVSELRNKWSGGHTVISDCKLAEASGNALVENYKEEGGRWQVLCNEHGHLIYSTNLPAAREMMKDPTIFCMVCRCIAGEGPEDWETRAGLVNYTHVYNSQFFKDACGLPAEHAERLGGRPSIRRGKILII